MLNTEQIKRRLYKDFSVIPEKIAPYRGGYIIIAYPKGMPAEKKQRVISPFYLYDSATNTLGQYSPAFDFDGFFKAMDHLRNFV